MPKTVGVAVSNATFHFDKLYTYAVMPGPAGRCPAGQHGAGALRAGEPCPDGRGAGLRCRTGERQAQVPVRCRPGLCLPHAGAAASWCYFLKERTFCTYYEAVKAVIPYGAQYKPTVAEDGVTPVLQKQLIRHTENAYKLVGHAAPKAQTDRQAAGRSGPAGRGRAHPVCIGGKGHQPGGAGQPLRQGRAGLQQG